MLSQCDCICLLQTYLEHIHIDTRTYSQIHVRFDVLWCRDGSSSGAMRAHQKGESTMCECVCMRTGSVRILAHGHGVKGEC